MKQFLLASALILIISPAMSEDFTKNLKTDITNVNEANVPSPKDIAKIQLESNKRVEYMVENYTLPELAQYAIRMNEAQRNSAKLNGTQIPPRLTREILEDRNKIADYLRSQYKYTY
ncbi:MAG: hypothetical protein MJ212_03300 [Alphaproteobacteria bacterium]|nr:hypothetical protein [Alphaproteobacteria bacterium]